MNNKYYWCKNEEVLGYVDTLKEAQIACIRDLASLMVEDGVFSNEGLAIALLAPLLVWAAIDDNLFLYSVDSSGTPIGPTGHHVKPAIFYSEN